jgi:hypothetical protein
MHARERALSQPLPSAGANSSEGWPSASEDPASPEDEWDERFIDLDKFLEMESGNGSRSSANEELEEDWSAWTRED